MHWRSVAEWSSTYERTAHQVTYAEFSKHQLIARSETERNESPSLPVRSFSLKVTMIKKCPEQSKWGSDTWEGFSAYTSQRRGNIGNGDQTAMPFLVCSLTCVVPTIFSVRSDRKVCIPGLCRSAFKCVLVQQPLLSLKVLEGVSLPAQCSKRGNKGVRFCAMSVTLWFITLLFCFWNVIIVLDVVACKSLCVCVRARTQMQKDMEIVSAEAFVEEGCVQ